MLAVAVFLATTFLFFRPHILGKAYFWDDFVEQVYPNRVYAGKALADGKFPHWNPYSFCGMPFQADVQTALYYPPYMIFDRVIGAQSQHGVYWLQLLIIAHFFVAQVTMFALARQLRLSAIAAIIAAVGYAFSAPLALHTHHPMFVEHLAWLPLLLRLIHRTIVTGSIAAIGWGSLVGGTMLLSGAPQMSLYALSLCAIMGLWWSYGERTDGWKSRLLALSRTVAILLIAIGMYGIQYFPSRQLATESERATLSYEQATEGSLRPEDLLTAVVPKAYGVALPPGTPNPMPYYGSERTYLYWDTAFYFGIGILSLAVWSAIAGWKESSLVKLLVISTIVAIVFALGSNGFLYQLVYHLPFFGQVRIPARMMFVASLAAPLLAGYGWDRLSRAMSTRQRLTLYAVLAATALLAFGTAIGALVSPPERVLPAIQSSAWSQIVLLSVIGIIVLLRVRGFRQGWLGLLIAATTFTDLYGAHAAFSRARQNPAAEYRAAFPTELRQLLLPMPPQDVFRVSMRRPEIIALKRNQGLVDGVMLFEGYNQLLLKRRHPAVASPEKVADLLAIRWTIGRDNLGRWAFLPRATAYPMAWLVHQVRVVETERVADVMRSDTTIDYRSVAVLEQEPPVMVGPSTTGDSIAIVQYDNDRLRYYVRCSTAAVAVLSEIFYPAWRAYVDGKPTELLRANYCLRSVAVPAGEHTIELRYESAAYSTGSLVTAASLAAALVIVALDTIRRLQSRTRSTER